MAKAEKKGIEKAVVPSAPAFCKMEDGIAVAQMEDGHFDVAFEFDRQLSVMLRIVPGAEYSKESGVFVVPAASADVLEPAVAAMRSEFKAIEADREAIMALAVETGTKAQREAGGSVSAPPKVSDYREQGRFYAGEVVNANTRFIAQLTGFGKGDGAAFVAVHRTADLDRGPIMKGDHIGIKYDAKFKGSVTDLAKYKSATVLASEFEPNLGKKVDGVTVTDRGDAIGVQFDLNPAMLARIRRIDGAAFNKDDKIWEVPMANKEFALRAAHDMRTEFVSDEAEVAMMKDVAATKMDGPKVSHAFVKDGFEHFGKVVAISDRYVLQKAGQEKFTLHYLAALDAKPEHDQNLSIKYAKGVGTVVNLDKQKAQDKAMAVGR